MLLSEDVPGFWREQLRRDDIWLHRVVDVVVPPLVRDVRRLDDQTLDI